MRHPYFSAVYATALFCCSLASAETKLGKPLTLAQPMTIAEVTAKSADYAGKTVQVKGRIAEVCQTMGCWMNLVDDNGKSIRIKVNDGEMVFPKTAAGKLAIAEGEFKKIELTKEQAIARAKHEAGEQGRAFNPAKVKRGATTYQIAGSGAVVLD